MSSHFIISKRSHTKIKIYYYLLSICTFSQLTFFLKIQTDIPMVQFRRFNLEAETINMFLAVEPSRGQGGIRFCGEGDFLRPPQQVHTEGRGIQKPQKPGVLDIFAGQGGFFYQFFGGFREFWSSFAFQRWTLMELVLGCEFGGSVSIPMYLPLTWDVHSDYVCM